MIYAARNAFAFFCFTIFIYILYSFYSGSLTREKLYGKWKAIEIHEEITFTENNFIRGDSVAEYKVRGDRIILSNGDQLKFTVSKNYLQLDSIFYLRK